MGTGGWAYFQVPGSKPLVAYSKTFNFVEVNSTFYQIPPLEKVENWKKLVPTGFKFAVRAHQSITHRYKLQPIDGTFETFNHMKQICAALNAEVLHLLVPSSLETIETVGNNLRKLLPSLNLRGLRLALEIRGEKSPRLPSELLKTMQEHDVVHCVDVSRGEMPKHETDILYTRLFGRGEHNVYQPTDVELQEIDNRASKTKSEKIVMSFHFVKMYKDAARFKTYRQTGKFPMLTRSTGLASLEEVLKEDTRFPTTRQELIRSQGWKVFDLSETEKIRAADMLNELPEGTYGNLGDVMDRLRTVMR